MVAPLKHYRVRTPAQSDTLVYDFSDFSNWQTGNAFYGSTASVAEFRETTDYTKFGTSSLQLETNHTTTGNNFLRVENLSMGGIDLSNSRFVTFKLHVNRDILDDNTETHNYVAIEIYMGSTAGSWTNYIANAGSERALGSALPPDLVFTLDMDSDMTTTNGTFDRSNLQRLHIALKNADAAPTNHILTFDGMFSGFAAKSKVLISFDDNHKTFYDNGYVYMQALGLKGTIACNGAHFPTGGMTGDDDTLEGDERFGGTKMKTMVDNGWQVVNHASVHTNFASGPLATATQKTYIDTMHDRLISEGWWTSPDDYFFVYVGGGYTDYAEDYLNSLGYRGMRTVDTLAQSSPDCVTAGSINPVVGTEAMKFMPTINLGGGAVSTAAAALAFVDTCIERGESIGIYGHQVVTSASETDEIATAEFEALCDGLKQRVDHGLIDVVTFKEFLDGVEKTRIAASR